MKNNLTLFFRLMLTISVLLLAPSAQTRVDATGDKAARSSAPPTNAGSAPAKGATLVDFSGEGTYEIFPNQNSWTFFGPTRLVAVAQNQKLVGFGSAVFGTNTGMGRIAVSLCYQKAGDASPVPFSADKHLTADVDPLQRTFAVSGTAALPPGQYAVGYCVVNQGKQTIGNNNYVNGWVMVVG